MYAEMRATITRHYATASAAAECKDHKHEASAMHQQSALRLNCRLVTGGARLSTKHLKKQRLDFPVCTSDMQEIAGAHLVSEELG